MSPEIIIEKATLRFKEQLQNGFLTSCTYCFKNIDENDLKIKLGKSRGKGKSKRVMFFHKKCVNRSSNARNRIKYSVTHPYSGGSFNSKK